MSGIVSSTPFALGAYLGNPDDFNTANETTFENNYDSFTSLMGSSPSFLDTYVDQTQPIDQWVGNSQWAAVSFAASADAKTTTPVIGLPLNSNAPGSLTPDQSFQAFASGQYDTVIQGIVQAWAKEGFTNLVFRPGWEMNLVGPTYAGSDPQSQADWVSAFQHVYTILHQAAAADGVNVQVVWNPGATNYSNAEATTNLYPGNNYVDVIGADAYSDIYPYGDGGSTPAYHDWATGGEDTSVAQFIANPINREHYWSDPAATEWSNDGSDGHSQSLDSLIQFAEQQGKPFAIPETGAGNSDGGTDVSDDGAFPQWLAQQLTSAQAAGENIDFVNLWDSNGGGNYEFSYASDGKPAEAAAWAKYFGAQTAPAVTPAPTPPAVVTPTAVATTPAASTAPDVTTIGSGSDTLALQIAEDAWQGDAQYTVSVDGTQIGGVQTATALQSQGQTQTLDVLGNFSSGSHTVSVDFLNDGYGGSSAEDRNLYVDGATIDGTAIASSTLALYSSGSQAMSFIGPAPSAVTIGAGSDVLALSMNEDAWQGNAQFTVSVDGSQIGGVQTASAIRSAGQTQTFDVLGDFGPGSHTVSVNFLNDAYGGSSTEDRNLYVQGATFDGSAVPSSSLSLMSAGPQSFAVTSSAAGTPDTLDLHLSEDAWQGDADYTIQINGTTIGGVRTATASHAAGATQNVSLTGAWGPNPTIGVTFINDAYGGSASMDRNLYVDSASYDGQALTGAPAALLSNGTSTFAPPAGDTPLTLHLSEDAWQGDAQYAVAVDGVTLIANSAVTASHSQGQSQAVNLLDSLSPGTHDVAVSFLNDAYGGSSSTDRNLYVTGLDVNQQAMSGATASLMSNGTQHFQIVVPASS